MNVFERAAKNRYRYPHTALASGITTEQLFDLPLLCEGPCLNSVAQAINSELQGMTTESFVEVSSPDKTDLECKLGVVKAVIEMRQEEKADAENKVLRHEKRKKLIEALAAKEDADMQGMTKAQLLKELSKLED